MAALLNSYMLLLAKTSGAFADIAPKLHSQKTREIENNKVGPCCDDGNSRSLNWRRDHCSPRVQFFGDWQCKSPRFQEDALRFLVFLDTN